MVDFRHEPVPAAEWPNKSALTGGKFHQAQCTVPPNSTFPVELPCPDSARDLPACEVFENCGKSVREKCEPPLPLRVADPRHLQLLARPIAGAHLGAKAERVRLTKVEEYLRLLCVLLLIEPEKDHSYTFSTGQ